MALAGVNVTSSPSRGTWIEMRRRSSDSSASPVVPLAGDVDRNLHAVGAEQQPTVVPLAGDVDRNFGELFDDRHEVVVPLAGDVDRNALNIFQTALRFLSSPSRGTWIEILA